MKERHIDDQIIQAAKQPEDRAKVNGLCRGFGMSTGTFFNSRSKYAGADVNEA